MLDQQSHYCFTGKPLEEGSAGMPSDVPAEQVRERAELKEKQKQDEMLKTCKQLSI